MALFQLFARNKRAVFFSLFLFVVVCIGVFGGAQGAYAGNLIGEKLAEGFGWLLGLVIKLLGQIFTLVLFVLMAVAQYNNFIGSEAVSTGWGVARDISNMFFVLVLLAIAAGTILQQEKYHYSKTLPKLILMAILINFSKTICGLLIDFAQVVMGTFVGAFAGAGPGNFMAALGVQNLLSMVGETQEPAKLAGIFGSLLFAVVYLFVALVVVTIIAVQLVIRIVALWFLVVLSPFAFFLSSFPQGEKYAAKWWEQFTNYVILGPVLAFFLWISLAVVQGAAKDESGAVKKNAGEVQIHRQLGNEVKWPNAKTDKNAEGLRVGESIAGTPQGIAGFILGIVMLLGSLVAAQQLASVGGSIAAKGMGFMGGVATGRIGPTPMRWARDTMGAMGQAGAQKRQTAALQRAQGISSAIGAVKAAPARALGAVAKVSGVSAGIGALKQAMLTPIGGTRSLVESKQRNVGEATRLRNEAMKERAKGGFAANWKADRMEVKAGTHEFGAKVDTLREKLPTAAGKVAQYGAAAMIGGPVGLAMIAPDVANMLGKSGKAQIASAQNFQRDSVARSRNGLKKKGDMDVMDIANGKKDGLTKVKNIDQMAAITEGAERGIWKDPKEIAEKRKQMQDLGADAQTMAEFDKAAGLKPEEAGTGAGEGGEKSVDKLKAGELDVGKISAGELEAKTAKEGAPSPEGIPLTGGEGAPGVSGEEGATGKEEAPVVSTARGAAGGEGEKEARQAKVGTFDSSGFYEEQDAQRAAAKRGSSPEEQAAWSKLFQETEQNKQRYQEETSGQELKELEEERKNTDKAYASALSIQDPQKRTEELNTIDKTRARTQRKIDKIKEQTGGDGEPPSAGAPVHSTGFVPSLPDGGAAAAASQESQNVDQVSSGDGTQSVRKKKEMNMSSDQEFYERNPLAKEKNDIHQQLEKLSVQQNAILKDSALTEEEKTKQLEPIDRAQDDLFAKKSEIDKRMREARQGN